MTETTEEGRALLDLIESLGKLAWAKFETKKPTFAIKDGASWSEDRSAKPPYTSFRFHDEDTELINQLNEAVLSYAGAVAWVMVGHKRVGLPGTNWTICPKRLFDVQDIALDSSMTAGQYMAKHEPEFGPIAYDDLSTLTAYLRSIFGEKETL